ncbi:MAG: coenzyme F420-0:L-glutamate ligase [Candidatus Methanosuratus sp.]|nr:coenzyme F420-0:L-glutamate ligase [Candidatus Methanosuratincola sp.]
MEVHGIRTRLVKPGDDLVEVALEGAGSSGLRIVDRDILAFSAKAVATAMNRIVRLSEVSPSRLATDLSARHSMDPAFVEVVIREADQILGGVEHAILTIKRGILVANAGVDQSNSPPGSVALWPEDPQEAAEGLRRSFARRGLDVGILVIDSRTLPLRMGNSGVAIGIAGIKAVEDLRGRPDLYGRTLRLKRFMVADNLASAAQLVMGESNESRPVALIRGAPVTYGSGYDISEAYIPPEECLIMHLLIGHASGSTQGCEEVERPGSA